MGEAERLDFPAPHRRQQLIDTGRPRLIKLAAFPKSIIAGSISRFPRPAANRNAASLQKKAYTRFSNRSAATFDRSIQPRISIRCQLPAQEQPLSQRPDFSRIIYACLSRVGRQNSSRLILRAFFPINGKINFVSFVARYDHGRFGFMDYFEELNFLFENCFE